MTGENSFLQFCFRILYYLEMNSHFPHFYSTLVDPNLEHHLQIHVVLFHNSVDILPAYRLILKMFYNILSRWKYADPASNASFSKWQHMCVTSRRGNVIDFSAFSYRQLKLQHNTVYVFKFHPNSLWFRLKLWRYQCSDTIHVCNLKGNKVLNYKDTSRIWFFWTI